MSPGHYPRGTLGASLSHAPVTLAFGTSGRRGLVRDLTALELFVTARGELEFLKSLGLGEGGIREGDPFYLAADLRPSSTQETPEGHGQIAQVLWKAIEDSGLIPVYLGHLPTPALADYALSRQKGSMMVTGSHIPFDRNGFKTNSAIGELLKSQEEAIAQRVAKVREFVYQCPVEAAPFDPEGRFKGRLPSLPTPDAAGQEDYLNRYLHFFGATALEGVRVLFYQHSAVGRDLVPTILRALGAEVRVAGRSDHFVPIDTENVDAACIADIQALVDAAEEENPGSLDAVVSTDGDSDRPLILGIDPETRKVTFFGGDLVGMVTADVLAPDAIVVPISCNDAIDRSPLSDCLAPKTRIGSPFVIEGMNKALQEGRQRVVGWEANGGFLTATPIALEGRLLKPLPTRDAVLPIVAVLRQAALGHCPLNTLFDRLPARFSRAGLLKNYPRSKSQLLLQWLCAELIPEGQRVRWPSSVLPGALLDRLNAFFAHHSGFGEIESIDLTDGLRIYFSGGDIVHLRPSGNADEFRVYAVADRQDRADALVAQCLREPDGLLRDLERSLPASGLDGDNGSGCS